MELTKEYFDEQLKSLATKNEVNAINQRIDALPTHRDLEKFATKDDLKNFATKDDLLRLATKDDLLELATKTDLNSVRDDVAEVKELVKRIDRRTDQDHRAALHDIEDLKQRVSILEKSAANQ
jgi:hypothetical protein